MAQNNQKGNKPLKRAAALKYDPARDAVPVLSAFGEGFMAEKIIETAEEAGVPIVPDADLSAMLSQMSVGDDIPAVLYEAVAKVLLFVGDLDREYGAEIRKRVKDKYN